MQGKDGHPLWKIRSGLTGIIVDIRVSFDSFVMLMQPNLYILYSDIFYKFWMIFNGFCLLLTDINYSYVFFPRNQSSYNISLKFIIIILLLLLLMYFQSWGDLYVQRD